MTEQDELNLFIINASGDFLTEAFPSNFAELDEGILHRFIQEHIWQPFNDYYDLPEQVYEFIEGSAYSTMRFVRTIKKCSDGNRNERLDSIMGWQIIKVKQDDGRNEYQVSDGNEYGRTYSYDFWTLHEAELCLNEVVTKAEHKEEV